MQADEEYGNIVWDKHFGHNRDVLQKQKQSFQLGGIINPFISLQNTSMGFMASDNLHHQEFLLQERQIRPRYTSQEVEWVGSETHCACLASGRLAEERGSGSCCRPQAAPSGLPRGLGLGLLTSCS